MKFIAFNSQHLPVAIGSSLEALAEYQNLEHTIVCATMAEYAAIVSGNIPPAIYHQLITRQPAKPGRPLYNNAGLLLAIIVTTIDYSHYAYSPNRELIAGPCADVNQLIAKILASA